MADNERARARNYDLFKGAVALVLLIIIIVLLLQGRTAPQDASPEEAELPVAAAVVPSFDPPDLSAGGTLGLSGSGEPGTTVDLWAGGTHLGNTTVGGDGTWSWDGTLEPGEYQVVARTLDASGQVLNESAALSLAVPQAEAGVAAPEAAAETATPQAAAATTAPEATTVPEPAVELALPAINPPELDTEGGLSLSGTGEPGATVELWAGDTLLGETAVGADGTWSWSGTLEPGEYQLVARTVDDAGEILNESDAASLAVPEPAVELALPAISPPELDMEGGLSLSGTGEPGATVELWAGDTLLGETTVGADGTWSWSGTLEPGEYQLVARTVDDAGEILNESDVVEVSVEGAAEGAAEAAPPVLDEPRVGATGTITLTGTAEPGTTVEILEDGEVVGTAQVGEDGTWSLAYQSAEGVHELAARSQADPEQASAAVSVEVPAAAAEQEPAAPAGAGEGEAYIVQPGDTLSGLAKRFYGNGQLWRQIFEGTNARAAEDPTFHVLENPNFIRPGWKLWIPAA